jgi:hypothetical protein
MAREIKSADARALEVEQQMTDDESFSRNAGSYCSSPRLRSQSATCIVATPGRHVEALGPSAIRQSLGKLCYFRKLPIGGAGHSHIHPHYARRFGLRQSSWVIGVWRGS